VARPVAAVDERIRRLVDDMLETMYEAEGVGLAATQVDVHERVIVIDVSDAHDEPLVLINLELTETSEETLVDEGCLSVPRSTTRCRATPRSRTRARPLGRVARARRRGPARSPSSMRWITCWARSSSST
jgi:peptide deformylase